MRGGSDQSFRRVIHNVCVTVDQKQKRKNMCKRMTISQANISDRIDDNKWKQMDNFLNMSIYPNFLL